MNNRFLKPSAYRHPLLLHVSGALSAFSALMKRARLIVANLGRIRCTILLLKS